MGEESASPRYDVLSELALRGIHAVVTGGSRGLGKAIARALASAGATVLIGGRDAQRLEAAAERIAHETGGTVLFAAADLCDDTQREQFIERARSQLTHVDVLFNNAGIGLRRPAVQTSLADWERVLRINLTVPFCLATAFAPEMAARGFGRIINVSSALGVIAFPGRSAYCASKGGLIQLTKALALEFAEQGITVNALCPGPFETETNRAIQQDPVAYQHYLSLIPQRRWARPEEIGPLSVYLASRASAFVTGTIFLIDGGWTAH